MKFALVMVTAFAALIISAKAEAQVPNINWNGNNLPCISYNIATAIANGAPANLTRTNVQAQINANRQASCGPAAATVAQLNNQHGAVVFSCDEYPFASSNQGGAGAQIMIVPLIENNVQGGQLAGFYNANNIGNGGAFTNTVNPIPQAGQLNLGVVNGFNVCYGGN